jgi:hypothetical protein
MFTSLGRFEELWGEIVYKNDDFTSAEVGDVVSFTPESEYEFNIDGEVLYRMYNKNICLKK